MSSFSFLHAADLHLDSPLLGLAGRSPDFAARVEDASRAALDSLVALAIEEGCRFVVLAGDVFDGDLRNVKAGLFFVSRMKKLQQAGLPVFIILGNHDAENRFMAKLPYSENVHLFSARAAETRLVDGLDVAVHGRSFPQRDVTENIARDYPAAVPGRFNIGLLHTALIGHEGEHAKYAPCTVEQLKNHGYDYWALGHVHERAVLSERPHIVYPGNLQGRSSRETGAKGASVVRVVDGDVAGVEHHRLGAVRWAVIPVDLSGVAEMHSVSAAIREAMAQAAADTDGRPLALRLRLSGPTPLHGELALRRGELREEVETLAASLPGDVWLEKLSLGTSAPARSADAVDPTIAGQIKTEIAALGAEAELTARLEAKLAVIRDKLPAGARADALFAQLRAEVPARAVTLALALVDGSADDALR